jgi:RNA polymerase-binding transcription factor DksA
MTKKELLQFEKALLAEKQRLLRQGNFTTEVMDSTVPDATGDLSSHRTHTADQGTENYQSELASWHKSAESQTLREINEALRRIADGTFGKCGRCGKDIPKARLEIVPHARLCIKCLSGTGK